MYAFAEEGGENLVRNGKVIKIKKQTTLNVRGINKRASRELTIPNSIPDDIYRTRQIRRTSRNLSTQSRCQNCHRNWNPRSVHCRRPALPLAEGHR